MAKLETSNFKRLIGNWMTEGTILNETSHSKIAGTDSYEFILDGNYILHKADVMMGDERSETFEIIEVDQSNGKGKMYYYNSKGERGVMTASLAENNFLIEGDKIKFEGVLHDDDTKVIGKWYMQTEQDEWVDFIDLKLTKQAK